MKLFKNRSKRFASLLAAMALMPIVASGQSEEPIITLKTNINEATNGTTALQFVIGASEDGYIDIDAGFGSMEYEITQAVLDTQTGTFSGTNISCNVSDEGIVKIYGDADKIDLLTASGSYITEIDLSKVSNIQILDLSNNELQALDLRNLSQLRYLSVSNNPFDVSPLVIGGNKPKLLILDMGRITNMDQSFNLTDYPSLMSFNAWANSALHNVDPSKCPLLRQLSIDSCPVESLDVSHNEQLTVLNISETLITSIDLTNNAYLNELYCDNMSGSVNSAGKLKSLDVTNNLNLMRLFASGNGFTTLDVTKNVYLTDLYINYNNLSDIDLSNNTNLYNVSIRNNNFTYATLPLPLDTWNYYDYKQNDIPVAKTFKEGDVLDLSDKVLRDGTVTTAQLYKTSATDPNALEALGEEYFTYADGKVTLHKALSDSVYMAYANDAFPETALGGSPLRTTKFKVKTEEDFGKDDLAISASVEINESELYSMTVGVHGASPENPKKVTVVVGNKKFTFDVTSSAPLDHNIDFADCSGNKLEVYVPEGETVSKFVLNGCKVESIDLSASHSLSYLQLSNCHISNIDLSWNCSLRHLDLSGNDLTTINLRGINGAYEKNQLTDINLSNNQLTSVKLNDMFAIHHLNLAHNNLAEMSLKDADNMLSLNLSYNQLSSVNLSYCTLLTDLDISHNKISSIALPEEISLVSVNCAYNALDFSTLPVIEGIADYKFAPQNDIAIPEIGPGCNLTKYNLDNATAFIWKKTDGTPLVVGTDVNGEGGVAHFLEPIVGEKVFCEMTNPKFPDLVLKTSVIEAAAMPTNVIAEFVTTARESGNLILRTSGESTFLYIDWSGTEADLQEYAVDGNVVTYQVASVPGATARVYSYSDNVPLIVFNLMGLHLESMNAAKLSNLSLFGVQNAGLADEDIILPQSPELIELRLNGNNFSNIDLTCYPKLFDLAIGNNNFSSFDASKYPLLGILSISNCGMTSFTANNPNLWSLDLSRNKLTDVDFSGVPDMYQLSLSHNQFSSVDLSPLTHLNVLYVDDNLFRISTLPLNKYGMYTYANQAPLQPEIVDGVVDLSADASVNGKATVYRWFIDVPSVDEAGNLVGEELFIDDEYTLDNGVTTFLATFEDVMCVMTNEEFPKAYFYTVLMDITSVGAVDNISVDKADISVYADGSDIRVNAPAQAPVALVGLNGALLRKAVVGDDGSCSLSNVSAGAYIVTIGRYAYKVIVK